MSDTPTDFIRARLDEDEQAAHKAVQEIDIMGASWYGIAHTRLARSGYDDAADHMERHDPARVLAQVAAMRRMLDLRYSWALQIDKAPDQVRHVFEAQVIAADTMLRSLAAIWSSHDDYDPAWAPEGE